MLEGAVPPLQRRFPGPSLRRFGGCAVARLQDAAAAGRAPRVRRGMGKGNWMNTVEEQLDETVVENWMIFAFMGGGGEVGRYFL